MRVCPIFFFVKSVFVKHTTVVIHNQKVIISPQKCALIPQNRSVNHMSLTFSLTKMIYALLSENVASHIYALLLAKFAMIRDCSYNT